MTGRGAMRNERLLRSHTLENFLVRLDCGILKMPFDFSISKNANFLPARLALEIAIAFRCFLVLPPWDALRWMLDSLLGFFTRFLLEPPLAVRVGTGAPCLPLETNVCPSSRFSTCSAIEPTLEACLLMSNVRACST